MIWCEIPEIIALRYVRWIDSSGTNPVFFFIIISFNNLVVHTGVFKGLHLSTTTAVLHQTNQSATHTTTTAQTFLQPSSNATTPSPANAISTSHNSNPSNHTAAALGILGCNSPNSTPVTTQVLLGNNICLSVPSAASLAGRHIPRTLGTVPASALKLSAATNLQMPKVSAASPMDMGSKWVIRSSTRTCGNFSESLTNVSLFCSF